MKKCPKCGSLKLDMERCIDGNTICKECNHKDKHKFFEVEYEKQTEYNCPKCKSEDIITEKRIEGDSECQKCNYKDKTYKFSKNFIQDEYDSNKFIRVLPKVILAKGGDGTLLRAINKFRHLKKPFFGVGAGTINFLMNDEDKIQDNAKYKKFHLIKVKVTSLKENEDSFKPEDPYESIEEFQAFNEVMMGGDMNSWIEFNVHDSDAIIGKYKGGGIAISTAQGSTGYNMGNGGSVLPLSSNQWVVTSTASKRDLNIPIEPKRTTITAKSRTPVTVWVDGQNHIIKNVVKIEVSQGDSITVIFNKYGEFKRKRRV